MTQKILPTTGDYTAAKLDFLTATSSINPLTGDHSRICVNRRHCRRLHPHGMKMIRKGLLTLGTAPAGGRGVYSYVQITEAGLAELARLRKRMAKTEKRHAQSPFEPRKSVALRPGRRGLDLLTKRVAFQKAARRG